MSKKTNKVYNLADLDENLYFQTTTTDIKLKTKKGRSNIFNVTLKEETSEFKLIDNDEQKNMLIRSLKSK